ncbi:MAG: ATP synthase F1 subunit epsilon [Thermoanaerobaculia bacterium]
MAKLNLVVVTPERKVVEEEADEVQLPGELGYLGILPGHTPLITLLKTGVLTYRNGGVEKSLAVSSGFAEISADTVSVLADLAEGRAQIDAAAAERERARAEEELKTASAETMEEIRTRLELASARLAVARGAP